MALKQLKPKKCKICKGSFQPMSSLQVVCCWQHAVALTHEVRAKQERQELRQARLRLKTRAQWMREAQAAFNAYIRERDYGKGCIDCGWQPGNNDSSIGGTFDAGHFLSVGSHPELRFVEDNCHLQRKVCNGGAGRFSHKARTVNQNYRERLIQKIGLARVLWLEGPHEPKQYTIEDLMNIKAHYKNALKLLKSA